MKRKKLPAFIERKKNVLLKVLRKQGVVRAGIFGSYARGEEKKSSDIDILIQVKRKKFSLLDLIGLEMDLEKELGKKIDLLTYKGIHPGLKESILREEVRLL